MTSYSPPSFIIANCRHGTFIVNRNDEIVLENGARIGVGSQILNNGVYEADEVALLKRLAAGLRQTRGGDVVFADVGANIGVVTVELAQYMVGWGTVWSFEPQKYCFYALCGNIVCNNCFNVTASQMVVSDVSDSITVPLLDPTRPASFGSLEVEERLGGENIGQEVNYLSGGERVRSVSIDHLSFPRLDLLKIDVEGMEHKVLRGGAHAIANLRPIILVEYIKSDANAIEQVLRDFGYAISRRRADFLAIHSDDPLLPAEMIISKFD